MTDGSKSVERKLTAGQIDMLERAHRTKDGNPWPTIGMRQRAGGAKDRMFETMKKDGLFDRDNCITQLGRDAYAVHLAKKRH